MEKNGTFQAAMFWTGLDERKLRPVLGRDSSCATSPTLYISFYHCIVSSGFMGHWNVPRSDCRVICASQQCINETAVHDRIEMKISWSASVLLHCIVVESEWRFCTFFVVSALKEPWLRNANDLWLALSTEYCYPWIPSDPRYFHEANRDAGEATEIRW